MKSVMISINPKWCEFIASGKKIIEVRKTKPKLKAPFKCYIYCTKASKKHQTISGHMVLNDDELFRHPIKGIKYGNSIELMMYEADKDYNKDNFLNGKVIGEFVCDFIYENISYDSKETCVSVDDMKKYANGKPLYGWHISDLVIYDRPKELSEFNKPCTDPFQYCQGCEHGLIQYPSDDVETYEDLAGCCFDTVCLNHLQKPPQSWCYVEEARV